MSTKQTKLDAAIEQASKDFDTVGRSAGSVARAGEKLAADTREVFAAASKPEAAIDAIAELVASKAAKYAKAHPRPDVDTSDPAFVTWKSGFVSKIHSPLRAVNNAIAAQKQPWKVVAPSSKKGFGTAEVRAVTDSDKDTSPLGRVVNAIGNKNLAADVKTARAVLKAFNEKFGTDLEI